MTIDVQSSLSSGSLAHRALYALTRSVSAAQSLDPIYKAALECLKECLGVEKASVLLFDPDGVLRFKAWLGLSDEYRQAVEGHSPWTPDTQDPEPVLVRDVAEAPELAELRATIEREDIRALAFIPLVAGGRLLGKFMLYYGEPRDFSEDDVLLSQLIACQIAFAIDQHRATDGLRDSERQYRQLMEGVSQAVYTTDAQGRIALYNEAAVELWGRRPEPGKDMWCGSGGILTPDGRPLPEEEWPIVIALREGRPVRGVEVILEREDGSRAYVLPNPTPLFDASGKVTGVVNILVDITQRKLAEETMALYAEIYANSKDAIAIISPDGRYTQQNPAHEELLGYTSEELSDQTPAIHMGESTFLEVARTLQQAGTYRGEVTSRTKDGRTLFIDLSAFAVRNAAGEVSCYVGIKRDITDRRRAEEATLRLGAIVESSHDAIISKDLSGVVTSWNQAAERIFGYTADEINGKSIRTIIPPERQQEEDDVLQRMRRGERVTDFDTVRRRKDGTDIHVSLTVSPIRTREGRIIGASSIARDVTDRKAAEEAVRRSIEIKDQFLSLVSHELRTPISTILGNGLLLLRRDDKLHEEDRRQAYADIVSEAEKLQENIEHLLLLTRLETRELETEPLSLERLVSRGIETFSQRHPGRQVSFRSDNGVPIAAGQETLVALVLQNLLTNADKYSPDEREIEVSLISNALGAPEVHVRDYGIGLDEHDVQNLFTPFYRSAKARGKASGLGLGLAVCKRVMEAQGGSIAAEPNQAGGSDFYFSLPAVQPAGGK